MSAFYLFFFTELSRRLIGYIRKMNQEYLFKNFLKQLYFSIVLMPIYGKCETLHRSSTNKLFINPAKKFGVETLFEGYIISFTKSSQF